MECTVGDRSLASPKRRERSLIFSIEWRLKTTKKGGGSFVNHPQLWVPTGWVAIRPTCKIYP